ncbi:myb/SANT-like DNA-binding domain-containing protein 3 isoform X5 [Falco biarmicus]|uniref:myb/SANT-like DNA-binding domain-containing protein 3 isoform X5 n=1 Tax=Falco biarmicus TaxID=345155 RepID=UPI0024BD4848|nr:myb/SANT-like DNA-binding domain-containing protein 3 isoform X5 [Falco biarmicus]
MTPGGAGRGGQRASVTGARRGGVRQARCRPGPQTPREHRRREPAGPGAARHGTARRGGAASPAPPALPGKGRAPARRANRRAAAAPNLPPARERAAPGAPEAAGDPGPLPAAAPAPSHRPAGRVAPRRAYGRRGPRSSSGGRGGAGTEGEPPRAARQPLGRARRYAPTAAAGRAPGAHRAGRNCVTPGAEGAREPGRPGGDKTVAGNESSAPTGRRGARRRNGTPRPASLRRRWGRWRTRASVRRPLSEMSLKPRQPQPACSPWVERPSLSSRDPLSVLGQAEEELARK